MSTDQPTPGRAAPRGAGPGFSAADLEEAILRSRPKLSVAELEAEILRSRTELAARIDELTDRVDPREAARELARDPRKVAIAAAAAAGVVGLVLLGRRRRR